MQNSLRASYNNLENYLKNYSLIEKLNHNPEILTIVKPYHKRLYALLCWQIGINNSSINKTNSIWFDECISDMIQCLLLLSQGFYKVGNFIHRSAIENFIKYLIVRDNKSLTDFTAVYQLFAFVKTLSFTVSNAEVTTRLVSIYGYYGELCNYVHTSNPTYCALSQALKEYPYFNETEFTNAINYLMKTTHIMNVCLFIIERPIFINMYHENKDAVLDNLTTSEKKVLA